jgi:hypothetical protein
MVQNATLQKRKRSTCNSAVKGHAQYLPDCLGELFGHPPTLKTEDNKVYWDFLNEVGRCIKPEDVIEWLRVKDVVDLSWEILRFRKLKITLIEIEREGTNAAIEWDREHPDEPYDDWMKKTSRPRTAEEIEFRKNRRLHDTETDSAQLLWKHIEQYEHIERLLTSAELRRDRILREIELRRADLSRRLRETTDEIIDAQVDHGAFSAEYKGT